MVSLFFPLKVNVTISNVFASSSLTIDNSSPFTFKMPFIIFDLSVFNIPVIIVYPLFIAVILEYSFICATLLSLLVQS